MTTALNMAGSGPAIPNQHKPAENLNLPTAGRLANAKISHRTSLPPNGFGADRSENACGVKIAGHEQTPDIP